MSVTDIVKFSVSDTAIAAMHGEYMGLSIADVNDTKGLRVVPEARLLLRASLSKPNALSTLDVDRRNDEHGLLLQFRAFGSRR